MSPYRARMPKEKTLLAREMRENPTKTEATLWEHLRLKRMGVKFRQQAPMLGYITDFYCPSARLVVEVDGESHLDRKAYDAFRDRVMTEHGLKVLRFEAALIESNLPVVLATIRTTIER